MTIVRSRLAGTTLIELIVVLAIIGLSFAIVGVAMRDRRSAVRGVDAGSQLREVLSRTRRDALQMGTPVTVSVRDNGDSHSVTAWPDGRIVADSAITAITGLNPLSGRTSSAASNANASASR